MQGAPLTPKSYMLGKVGNSLGQMKSYRKAERKKFRFFFILFVVILKNVIIFVQQLTIKNTNYERFNKTLPRM